MTDTVDTETMTDAQKYLASIAEATAATEKAREAYDAARIEWERAHVTSQGQQSEQIAILRNSSDPLVAWIGRHAAVNYPEHSRIILEALPATLEQLEKVAAEHDWCSDWDRYLQRAVSAGVIKESEKSKEYTEYLTWYRRNYGTYRDVERRMGALIASERTAAVEEYKAQQAAASPEVDTAPRKRAARKTTAAPGVAAE